MSWACGYRNPSSHTRCDSEVPSLCAGPLGMVLMILSGVGFPAPPLSVLGGFWLSAFHISNYLYYLREMFFKILYNVGNNFLTVLKKCQILFEK
jgi:hypothetical protein